MFHCRAKTLSPVAAVSGLILAGGRASRMGGCDKGLVDWRGQALICHVLKALAPQVSQLYINANRNQEQYAELCKCQVLADALPDFQGPLTGIAAGLAVVATPYVVVVPCDAPRLPDDLVARLEQETAQADIVVAHDGARLQSLHLMLHTRVLASLQDFMQSGGRKPDKWYQQHGYATVDCSDTPEAFSNFNTLQDLA